MKTITDRYERQLERIRERNARKIERLALLAALARLNKRGMTFGRFMSTMARSSYTWGILYDIQVTQVARALMPKTVAAKKKRKKSKKMLTPRSG